MLRSPAAGAVVVAVASSFTYPEPFWFTRSTWMFTVRARASTAIWMPPAQSLVVANRSAYSVMDSPEAMPTQSRSDTPPMSRSPFERMNVTRCWRRLTPSHVA